MIEINEYDSIYTAKIADTWNKNTSNCSNINKIMTVEDVISYELIIVKFKNSIRRGRNEKIN